MLKSKEVSTCLIIAKLYSCVYRTSANRTVAIAFSILVSTHCLQNVACPQHESNVFACCNETNVTCGGNWSSCWCNSCCRCNFTVAVSIVFVISKVVLLHENASRPTFVRPISVSHLGISVSHHSMHTRLFRVVRSVILVVFPVTALLFHTRFFRTCIFQPCSLVL